MLWLAFIIYLSIALPVCANTLRVPNEVPTIQASLDSIQDGDTVLISLGIYTESLIAPLLRFVLKGDVIPDTGDYPRPVIDPTPLPGSDSLPCLILPEGSHPILEDLVFRNGPEMYPRNHGSGGIRSFSQDPIFRRILMDSVAYGIKDSQQDSAVITAESCCFRNSYGSGISAFQSTAVNATDCIFTTNSGASGIESNSHSHILRCSFQSSAATGNYLVLVTGEDIRVESCIFGPAQFSGSGSSALSFYEVHRVRAVNNIFTNCFGGSCILEVFADTQNTVEITGNSILSCNGSAGAFRAIWTNGSHIGPMGSISNNTFIECSGFTANAITLNASINLHHNRFFNMGGAEDRQAILIYPSAIDSGLHILDNLFYETRIALRNQDTTRIVDTRWNWWGHASGPYHSLLNPLGHGDEIQGHVTFTPWYTDTSFFNLSADAPRTLHPSSFSLSVFPNPFNSIAKIKLQVKEPMIVKVDLFDLLGRKVKELYNAPVAYEKEISFQADNLSSGVYFVRATETIWNRPLATSKLLLLK